MSPRSSAVSPEAWSPDRRPEWRRAWGRDFLTALIVLLTHKILLWVTLGRMDAFHSVFKSFGKLPLFVGSDVLGAALLASLIALLASPLRALGMARAAKAVSLVLQPLHSLFSAMAAFNVVFMGGLINKQAIDLAFVGGGADLGERLEATVGSALTFFTPSVNAALVATMAFSLLVWWQLPGVTPRLSPLAYRFARRGFVSSAFLTVLVMPRLMSGEIGGLRIYTAGLEKSPSVELIGSYLMPMLRSGTARVAVEGDPFRLDLKASYETLEAPVIRGSREQRTSVVLVLMESVGAPFVDSPKTAMPFLRELGERAGAVRFLHHYSTWSLTTKALFSIICSEYPYPSYLPITRVNPRIPCESLSEILHGEGYRTAFISSQRLGYDELEWFLANRAFDHVVDANAMPGRDGAWFGKWGVDELVTAAHVLDWVKTEPEKPFFAIYNQLAGHHPYIASREQEANPEGERVAEYLRALGTADDGIRLLVEGLEAQGRLDDTLLIVVSDHGEGHGRQAGRNVYESVIKVPLVMYGPQLRGAETGSGNEVDVVTGHVDIAPTLLSLLGMEPPFTMKGRDLRESTEADVVFFGGRPPKQQFGLTDGPWKYIIEDDVVERLFDRRRDPEEGHNLISEHPQMAKAFKARIAHWLAHSEALIEDYTALKEAARPKQGASSQGRASAAN